MIFAETGVGKSLFTMTVALAIAGGGKFLDWKAPEPKRVLWIDGEMWVDDLQKRAADLIGAVEGINREAAGRNFVLLARQEQTPGVDFIDLAEEEWQTKVVKYVSEGINGSKPFDLVVLDNLSTLATSLEQENDAVSFNPVLMFLMTLKQAGAACILVHHSNKAASNYRGSSKLATTFEVILQLQREVGAAARDGAAFVTDWDKKYRGLRDATIRNQTMWLSKGDDGRMRWQAEVSKADELAELVRLVETCNYSSGKELAEAMKRSESWVSKAKTQAIVGKLIKACDWDRCLKTASATSAEAFGLPIDEGDF